MGYKIRESEKAMTLGFSLFDFEDASVRGVCCGVTGCPGNEPRVRGLGLFALHIVIDNVPVLTSTYSSEFHTGKSDVFVPDITLLVD